MTFMKAHAKVNLFLSVGPMEGKKHRLKTVFQPLTLHDKILVEESVKPGIHVECNISGVPKDRRNTAYWAAEMMAKEAGRDLSASGIKS